MAILSTCPGLTVEILINGVPLQEYEGDEADEELESPDMVKKYIEAQSGIDFAVSFTPTRPLPAQIFSVTTYLDGIKVRSTLIRPQDFSIGRRYVETGRKSVIRSQTVLQKYQFSDLAIVEGRVGRIDRKVMDKVASFGEIKVSFCKVTNMCPGKCKLEPLTMAGADVIPEKALKGEAKTHGASLKAPQATTNVRWYSCTDDRAGPFATLVFKYRSLVALQALGIVPREPTPVPLEERPEDELSPEELRQLVKRLKNDKAAAIKIKKERNAKRERASPIDDGDDETDDLEVVGAGNKRRRLKETREVIVLD
ncbi:hypothetical protein EJ07DRAFT_156962 [Lizonia empirigonia]|nr:hypothetical protein EJ07DRAFT_156962 [Lizonia empirigonia]